MKRIYILLLIVGFTLSACTDKFEDFNTDKKNPAIVSGEALFSNAERALSDQVNSTSVNLNVWKFFAQYWTATTYVDEANYDIVNRNIPDNTFQEYYSGNDATRSGGFLKDFKEASDIISKSVPTSAIGEGEKSNKLAIIEILTVYAYQNLVDMFGNVPYTQALDITKIHPVYDDAATIYQDLINRLDAALGTLDPTQGSFGTADLIYGGDVAQWILFGNSLKLKIGITLADVNPTLSKATVESAVAGGVFASADDSGLFPYLGAIHTNPIYEDVVQSGRDDFVPANTIVNLMNSLSDPRRPFYFTLNGGVYVGGIYGASNPFSSFSHIESTISSPGFHGFLLTYDEVLFYLAEAAARGYSVGGTVESFYNSAVTASIVSWGGTPAQAATYLATPQVAYATAPGTWQQKIGTQAYIAFYTRGLEGFTEWRRLDYPILNLPPTLTDYSQLPKRFTYPVNEQTLNNESYASASQAIGGDLLTTKLFWDIH
jgi:hypothetical protein